MYTETWYANTECDLLAFVYACKHFHTYLYHHSFTVETAPGDDHPKNVSAAPSCLKRMLHHLKQYDAIMKHRPGTNKQLLDALSRLSGVRQRNEVF